MKNLINLIRTQFIAFIFLIILIPYLSIFFTYWWWLFPTDSFDYMNNLYMEIIFFSATIFLFLYSAIINFYYKINKNKFSLDLLDLSILFFLIFLLKLILFGFYNNFFYNNTILLFNNYYLIDSTIFFYKLFVVFFLITTLILTRNFVKFSYYNPSEFFLIIIFAGFLLFILPSLNDFFSIFIVIESLFFLFLGIIVTNFSKSGIETILKYFIQNILVSGITVFGILMMYYKIKTLNFFVLISYYYFLDDINKFYLFGFIFFLLSFFFKIGLFPVHFYVPDVYEVSPLPSIYFFSALVKPIFFLILINIVNTLWQLSNYLTNYFIYVGIISMVVGSLGAYVQTNFKRFLGYTSINQYGFLIICLASMNSILIISYIIFYIILYSLVQFFLFFIITNYNIKSNDNYSTITSFSDLYYIFNNNYYFKILFSIFLFFISGLPPFILFIVKFFLLSNLILNNMYLIVVLILFFNVINLTYYLNILKIIWFEENYLNNLKISKLNYYYYNTLKPNFEFYILLFFIFLIFVVFFNFDNLMLIILNYIIRY